MKIRSHTQPPKAVASRKPPGPVQRVAEAVAGVAMGAFRVPSALATGLVIGGYQGGKIGHSVDHGVTPESIAKGMLGLNVVMSLARSVGTGFLLAGGAGAMAGLLQESVQSSMDVYMFVKTGSAQAISAPVHASLTQKIEAGQGTIAGAGKGMWIGSVSTTKAAAQTGYEEGKGAVAGVAETLSHLPNEWKTAQKTSGNILVRSALAAAGAVSAVISAPAGLALGFLETTRAALSTTGQKLVSCGVTAATGAVIGLVGGPIGSVVGGAVGACIGLFGPPGTKDFHREVVRSVEFSAKDAPDLGTNVANKYRDIIRSIGVGTAAGMRAGWDATVT